MGTRQAEFDPYTNNGGSILAIAGEDYCIVAGDTRQSDGYVINCRYSPKTFKLNPTCVLATSGFHADGLEFTKELLAQLEAYQYEHGKTMKLASIAQAASIKLYSRRFFPFYTFNILGGLDEQGKGVVYVYDPVGSFEKSKCGAWGSGSLLIQPFLDDRVGCRNRFRTDIDLEEAIRIARDAFMSAAERDIYTGDCVQVWIVTREEIRKKEYELKRD